MLNFRSCRTLKSSVKKDKQSQFIDLIAVDSYNIQPATTEIYLFVAW